ncbi:MAG TPA: ammonia channel protein, partial [Deltaproteobacteria bacterium]|nr:ammonia channel protein [Deltaproteobacteria bacterium]
MVSSGDTAWMLVSTALVMIMTPGLGLFYGGMVRTKNVLGTIMQSFMCLGIVSVIWVLYGYSLAFGPDMGG